ncbi:MAG TPA: IS4 family transposase [Chloroflexi bacterium]|nr:IS4 family transposase [Chloroflexota bacterium]
MAESASFSSSEYQWCLEEFAAVDLQDARLNYRCGQLAVQLAMQTQGPINQACEDWADIKAAYRFFDHDKATPEGIRAPHQQRTVERMAQHARVLAVQDPTFLNYTHHPQTEGLGPIGTKSQKQGGFGLHSTLASTPEGLPLGVLTQAVFIRPEDEPPHRPEEWRLLPIEDKASYRWRQAFEQTLALAPPGVEVITVCDREADIDELVAVAQPRQAPVVVRASSNRALLDEEVRQLWPKVEGRPIAGQLSVHRPGNDKRPAREATVSARSGSVTLRPPWRPNGQKLPAVTLNAVLVREENPPADIDEPIEWLLLTNTPVTAFEEAQGVIAWYCARWQIEVFHKVLKSGGRVEACRLQTADRLHRFVALMSVIAWRLHWMTYINHCQPDLPWTGVLTTSEWQALSRRIHQSSRLPDTLPTVHQAVRWIAQLGGFLARTSDGEPGVTTLWRGWQRLQDLAATWHLVKEQTQLVGNR